MKINFSDKTYTNALDLAHTFRYTETPDFKQYPDCIECGANEKHPEGFDNMALMAREAYNGAVHASLTCAFEDCGCPEIILVPNPERTENGLFYGECYEVVLYKNGINIWRHFRENGKCHWHLTLGVSFAVTENEKHTLDVVVQGGYITARVDKQEFTIRIDDMFESFYVGFAACEGVVRFYECSLGLPDAKKSEDELEKMDEFFERRLDTYDSHMLEDIEYAKEFYPLTASLLPVTESANVLDLGCGTGLELEEYFKLNPSAKVTGIDLCSPMLDELERKLGSYDVTTVHGSYFDLPLGEALYDAAVSVESLHHFKKDDKVELYKKLRAALKDGGYFILTDYIIDSDETESELMREFASLRGLQGKNDGNLYHFDTPLTVEHECDALREAGFSSAEVIKCFGNTKTIKAIK